MAMVKRPGSEGLYDPQYEKDSCGVGFLAHIKGHRSHQILQDASNILCRMDHRGARGAEQNTGDGAGILTALPWEFLEKVAKRDADITLPARGTWAAGLVFLPQDKTQREACQAEFAKIAETQGLKVLGWRKNKVDNSSLGPTARASEPSVQTVFVSAPSGTDSDAFDRKLFLIRKKAVHTLRNKPAFDPNSFFYICSLSTKIIVYKGMLTPEQVWLYYQADLDDTDYKTHLAMCHSRFSTNTFPSWDRAQPLRYMSHNGEINTVRGNINKMFARQKSLESALFGPELSQAFPIIEPDLSDSGAFDNVLELLLLAGRRLPEAVMMMIPEAWQNHLAMDASKKSFYKFHSAIMEPWDGPASISFTDGKVIGAVLDRNGLRPSRFYVTKDDVVIMASEVGVMDIPEADIRQKGRLQPGKMFLVDFEQGRIIDDAELKAQIAGQRPYGDWVKRQEVNLADLKTDKEPHGFSPDTVEARLKAFGYTEETLEVILKPMAVNGQEPLGSMGNDAPLAVLSDKPRVMYDYFKQLFAQVTNPPIDSIREEIVMSLESYIGPERNLLETTEQHAHRLYLPNPLLTNEQLSVLKHIEAKGWKTKVIDITYAKSEGDTGLVKALDRIAAEAEQSLADGFSLLILSDRAVSQDRVPVSALLATGTVHHHLTRLERRNQIGLLVESGEPREVHHYCMLAGFGADAVNPYLTFEALEKMILDGRYDKKEEIGDLVDHYLKAVSKGMRKVFGKMGISTLESYKGAQIFEAVGLNADVVKKAFAGTASRIEGAGFEVLASEALQRHALGWPTGNADPFDSLPNPGDYHYRFGGEKHMWDPESIADLQRAVWQQDQAAYDRFATRQAERSTTQATLHGLLKFKTGLTPVPLDEVESAAAIVKRFVTGAMSYGSISLEAHQTLAVAMNRLGGKSNTGEGGEDPARYNKLANGDSMRSAIKQVASGRFGVTIHYLSNADEIQIKMAQGAKPGEGGELPGDKVDKTIAKTRGSTPGVGLISPPPHHDIYSIEDLAQLIYDLKNANPKARISVKLVSEVGVGTIAAGVAKGHADHILVSGHEGGTGASPLTGVKNAGLPWELGIAETHQTLVMNDLRSRVTLQTDGQLKTGRDMVIAALLGAEEMGFATGPLITLGCIMMRKCHKNTCPVGIATQDPKLRERFKGKAEYVERYFHYIAEEARKIMASLGVRTVNELVGRVDLLETDAAVLHWKSRNVDLSKLLSPAKKPHPETGVYKTQEQDHGLEHALDNELIRQSLPALDKGQKVEISSRIVNVNRSVGTLLSHEITKRTGADGLPDGTITVRFTGHAGQSFGAFLARGVTFRLEGDANDYVGKGLSGGRIIIAPPMDAGYKPSENILLGNVAFYGATSGEAYLRGIAAERFAVRNSGATVVVEGVGDHGCEYMTRGEAVILGGTGRNFAAGMSGGVAYVWDPKNQLKHNINLQMVALEIPSAEELDHVKTLVQKHYQHTGSDVAETLLAAWETHSKEFVLVMPVDYKKVLQAQKTAAAAEVK
jgi:glutamate synthase (NADPH/NADH) large chain